MPTHGSKKQSQRTKGNLKPSSSSQAAELLTSAGTASTGFIGFGSGPKYVPASSALDDLDTSLDSDFRLVLRKLTKKDATTKIKGLQEFGDLCKEKTEEDLKGVLPFWPRIYNKVALDVDYRVREAAQQAMSALVVQVRRNLAPYLRGLMGAWLLSQCDTYPTVASAALAAFQNAFPPVRQTEALVFCKDSILEYLTENLVTHTPQSLSDPKSTETEDMENKYNRVLTASLLATRKLMSSVPANQIKSLTEPLTLLFENSKFWKHGKSKVSMVKGAMYSFLAGLCQLMPEVGLMYSSKISPLVLHNLDETDPVICTHLWEACLAVVSYLQDYWSHVNVQKAFWPKLRKVLETGCYGNAVVIAPNLLPLLSKIPPDMFPDKDKFYEEYFNCFKLGLSISSVQKSTSECSAVVRAFMECAQYVVSQNAEKPTASHVLMDQVLPVVEASLLEKDSPLFRSPLYSMMGLLLSAIEKVEYEESKLWASHFWTHLKESVIGKLTSAEEFERGDNFEEKLIFLVRCLFYPQTEVKQKTGKVKFEVSSDVDALSKIPKIEMKTEAKASISELAKKFVHELIVVAFNVAHKQFSTCHLRIFAQLLELDPSDEVVAKVIACCHGDVAMETASHYFVSEICIPWIQKLHTEQRVSADFTHLVHIACIFLPALDKDSVRELLDKVHENCRDSHSQHVFLEMLFSKARTIPAVQNWLQTAEFGERLVRHARAVCDRDVDDNWREDTTNVLNILSLVLAVKAKNNELLVPRKYIDSLLAALQLPLKKIAVATYMPNRADLALSFVAKAAQCFFTKYQDCLVTGSARGLIETLFQVSLCNQCHVTDETLSETRDAWTIGVAFTVQKTGGSLLETGLLSRLVQTVHSSVASTEFSTLAKLSVATENVEILLETLKNNLPIDPEEVNPVHTAFCEQLLIKTSPAVSSKIWEYVCIKGDYPCMSRAHSNDTAVTRSLFTSLFNCKILRYMYGGASEDTDVAMETNKLCSDWSEVGLQCLLDCLQTLAVVATLTEINTSLTNVGDLGEALTMLSSNVQVMVTSLTESTRDALWRLAFTRVQEETDYVLCLKPLLSLIRGASTDPLVLELSPLLDRSSMLTSDVVYMLLSTMEYLSPVDKMNLSEVMVARLLSLDTDSVTKVDGGLGMLCVISHLIHSVPEPDEGATEMFLGALDQIISWKEDRDDLFLYSSNLSQASKEIIILNAEICRVLTGIISRVSGSVTDKQWDFIMCSLASWIQTIEETDLNDLSSPMMQCYSVSVLDLLTEVAICLREKVGKVPEKYPDNLVTEWTDFFGESIFGVILSLFVKVCKMQDVSVSGSDRLFLTSVCNAAAQAPKCHILEHKLPPLLVAGDLSPLPDNLQTLLNHLCPLLVAKERSVQVAAFHILHSIVDTLPQYDKEEKSFDSGATGGEEKEENVTRSPPTQIMNVVDESSSILEALIGEVPIESKQPITFQSEEYHYAMAYLLSWKLLLHFFKSAPSELRQEYAGFFKEHGHVDQLMCNIFRMMPNSPGQMFQIKPDLDVKEPGNATEIQHVTCALYLHVLKTMPAMARAWWKDQDRKTAAYVDVFTTKYVSHILCTSEIQAVQKTDVHLQDMTIKARPKTREVIAVYSLEEVRIEMVISLPKNYPLGHISVVSEKRVGVSGPQWEKWLLQLNIFLQHQNGNILDGLKLWKNNIDKRFEGVDECMICFYVLHGTNFQLPRLACRTCKKKFHSSCLYKWFNTSHNCTCPLCRNVF